jgi:hypothetical protein
MAGRREPRWTGANRPPAAPLTAAQWRTRELRRLRARLEQDGFPRLEMMLLVAMTGGVGLVASWALRMGGLASMGWRYLLVVTIAYLVFLGLLRAWLDVRNRADSDVSLDFPSPDSHHDVGTIGAGGDFGGAGATGTWDAPAAGDALGGVGLMGADAALDVGAGADEAGCLIVPLILLAVLVFSALTVVWSAPTLFAEVLLDVLLAAGLYRRLRRTQGRHWLETAVRRTAWPFAITAVVVCVAGFALQAAAPAATTLGEALAHLRG